MPNILIVEATPAVLIAQGRFDFATCFRPVLRALDPSLSVKQTNPYDTPFDPQLLTQADAVIFAGSSVDWTTDAPEAAPLRAAMEMVFAAGKPVWGSCNGLQLAAVVLGGAVGASTKGVETGLARDVRITEVGRGHPMLATRQNGFAAPCIHRDEVTRLPDGAQLLAGNAHSPVQSMAFVQGGVEFWGTQYHPELSLSQIALASGRPQTALQSEADPAPELANWLAQVQARQT